MRDAGLRGNDARMGREGVKSVQPLQRFLTPAGTYRCLNAV